MRVLWASNAPFLATGYGVQTSMVAPRLQLLGHEVAIACNHGLEGGMLPWPGPREPLALYPVGLKGHKVDIVANHAEHFNADVIMTHYDAWCFNQARLGNESFRKPWVPWFPIDCDDVPRAVLDSVRGITGAAYRITQTRHGQDAMHSHGAQCAYVPASYDGLTYRPHSAAEKAAARKDMGIEDGRFMAMMVAANTGTPDAPSRKSFPQVLQAWKWFLEVEPDALLYLHCRSQGHLDLDQAAGEMGIGHSLRFAHSYFHHSGMYPAEDMATLYSVSDVLLNPAMGEGFGVPMVEAQACGTPVISGDWTAMSEVTKTGYKIPKSEAARYQMLGYGGDQFIPKSEAIRDALVESTKWAYDEVEVSEAVSEYELERVWEDHWVPVLAEVEELFAPKPEPGPNREQRRRMKYAKQAA